MKKIKLTQEKYAFVDDKDFKTLNQFKWYTAKKRESFYAVRTSARIDRKHFQIYMHTMILKTPKGKETDHIDGNGLNNQKKNLRICTASENRCNIKKYKNNTSGFKGVCWDKFNKKWRVSIRYKNENIWIGRFISKEKAREAYVKACIKHHKKFANF